jgi:hypothetical protein
MPAHSHEKGTGRVGADPASSYGREKPGKEAGMGKVHQDEAPPADIPDKIDAAVANRQRTDKQINSQDANDGDEAVKQANKPLQVARDGVEGSMWDEEPRGEDLTPTDIHDPKLRRHPRTEGKGGTP